MNAEVNRNDLSLGTELKATLQEPWRFHYPQETINAILYSKERCMRLAQGLGLDMSTPEVIQNVIENAFKTRHEAMVEIAKQRSSNPDYLPLKGAFNQSKTARTVNFICVVAHTLTPILKGDWSINRTEELKSQIGFDTIDLEEAGVEFMGTPEDENNDLVHVHFGPGDGTEMERLRDRSSVADKVREIGIGYALHFDPLTILKSRMVEVESPQTEGVKAVIRETARKALDDRWYKKRVSKGILRAELTTFDCNDLYDIVNSLPALIDAEPRRIPTHIEFENEHIEFVSAETYEALLRFQDVWSEPQIEAKVNIFKRDLLKYKIHELGPQIENDPKNQDLRSEIERLKSELNSLTQSFQSPQKPDLAPEEAELIANLNRNEAARKTLGAKIKAAIKAKEDEEVAQLKEEGKALAQEHKRLKAKTKELYDSLDAPAFPISNKELTEAQIQFLTDFFSTDFLGELHQSPKNRPDLNFEVEASPHNFIPSVFTELDQYIPSNSVSIATDSRSESHQNDEDFEATLRKKFTTLRPGGFSVGDGFKQSFTRVMRWV